MQHLQAYSSSSDDEDASGPEVRFDAVSFERRNVVCGADFLTASSTNSTIKGYVSKRKPSAVSTQAAMVDMPLKAHESQLITVKRYLSSISELPQIKRGRKEYEMPKAIQSVLSEHSNAVMDICWHPYHPHLLLSASFDGTVKLWDAACTMETRCIKTYGHHSSGVRVAEWISSSKIISGGYDKCCKCVNIETGQTIGSFNHTGFVTALKAHSENKDMIVSGDINGNVQSWDLRSEKKVAQFVGAGGSILSIEFLHNGNEFIATSDIVRRNAASQAVVVWDIASTAVLSNQVYIEPYTCPYLKAHPCEPYILTQSNGNYIVLFSSDRPYKLNKYKRYEGHTVEGFSVAFDITPDGTLICSGSADGRVYFYDYRSSKLLKSFSLGKSPTLAVAVHPSLQTTVAVSNWVGSINILN